MSLTFEWDARKDAANQRKHGVSFGEASTVFGDPLGWFRPDDPHSGAEERLFLLGLSSERRLLAVMFTERGTDHIRLVSARLATPRERRTYEEDFR
jgi:uncharacterized DUF497 family protein